MGEVVDAKKFFAAVLMVIAVGLLGVGAYALVSGDTVVGAADPQTSDKGSKSAEPAIAPLTGLPQEDAALRNRPAVVVKVDNAPEARPQFGIDKADIVYEEKVEGGLTRFLSVFHSQDSSPVGPVRSLRSTDVYALRPLGGAVMGYSGGIQPFKDQLPSSNLYDASADAKPSAFSRMKGRSFVNSLQTSTSSLREFAPPSMKAPKQLFSYNAVGAPFEPAGFVPASGLSGSVSNSLRFDWTYDSASNTYKRATNGKVHALTNGQIQATNVVIQFVPYAPTPYKDAAKSPVDEALLQGTGDAIVLSNGKAVNGRWLSDSLAKPTLFNDAAGQPVKLTPGTTWVILVPQGNAASIRP